MSKSHHVETVIGVLQLRLLLHLTHVGQLLLNARLKINKCQTNFGSWPVWPDWAIYWTLGNFLKPLATLNLPNSYAIFVKVLKSIIFLVKSFLGNFYRHLEIFSGHTGPGLTQIERNSLKYWRSNRMSVGRYILCSLRHHQNKSVFNFLILVKFWQFPQQNFITAIKRYPI